MESGRPGRTLARGEACVEEQLATAAELREKRLAAPPDEHVVVWQHLHVALGVREHGVRVGVFAKQGGGHRILVELYHYTAGLLVLVHPTVVEDRYDAVTVVAGVVLVVGPSARTHVEVGVLPAKPPCDLARLAVDLVDSGSPAG